jgi:hypothetical protein
VKLQSQKAISLRQTASLKVLNVKIGADVWSVGRKKKYKRKEKSGLHEEFGTLPIRPLATDPHLF